MLDDLQKRIRAFQRCIEKRDRETAEEILDDDYALVFVYPRRTVVPRPGVHSYKVEEEVLDVDGDCATALHRATMTATVLGEDRSGVFIISDFWRLRDGTWRLWRRHSTPVSAGDLPGDRQ